MSYTCPVCGYDRLFEAPQNFTICPSCGTEFEYDDSFLTHAELRVRWLRNGAQWWSTVDPKPSSWNPYIQVQNVGLQAHWSEATVDEHGELVLGGLQFEPGQPVEVLVVAKPQA